MPPCCARRSRRCAVDGSWAATSAKHPARGYLQIQRARYEAPSPYRQGRPRVTCRGESRYGDDAEHHREGQRKAQDKESWPVSSTEGTAQRARNFDTVRAI